MHMTTFMPVVPSGRFHSSVFQVDCTVIMCIHWRACMSHLSNIYMYLFAQPSHGYAGWMLGCIRATRRVTPHGPCHHYGNTKLHVGYPARSWELPARYLPVPGRYLLSSKGALRLPAESPSGHCTGTLASPAPTYSIDRRQLLHIWRRVLVTAI